MFPAHQRDQLFQEPPHLVRAMPEEPPAGAQQAEQPFIRVVTPSGKVGYALEEALSSLDIEQICYVKEATGWKIAGYAGGDLDPDMTVSAVSAAGSGPETVPAGY